MKALQALLLVAIVIATFGCRPQSRQDTRTQMALDSDVSGKEVTIIRPKEAVRPDEPITEFGELRTIMQSDIDAAQKTSSKEVVYVKPGETARPSETKR